MTLEEATYLESGNPRVPKATVGFRHCVELQTRFSDIDALGHVNNNVYFAFMDLGKIEYFRAISDGRMSIRDIRSVVVHVSADFYEPSFLDDQLAVYTTIPKVGDRSFTIEQRIVDRRTGATKCIGTTILAGFDPATQQGAQLDPAMVAAASAYERRDLLGAVWE